VALELKSPEGYIKKALHRISRAFFITLVNSKSKEKGVERIDLIQ